MVMHCLGHLDQVEAIIMLGLAGGLAEQMQIRIKRSDSTREFLEEFGHKHQDKVFQIGEVLSFEW